MIFSRREDQYESGPRWYPIPYMDPTKLSELLLGDVSIPEFVSVNYLELRDFRSSYRRFRRGKMTNRKEFNPDDFFD